LFTGSGNKRPADAVHIAERRQPDSPPVALVITVHESISRSFPFINDVQKGTSSLRSRSGCIIAFGLVAQQSAPEAPAAFDTPTLQTPNAGPQSVSNGIAEPPGDT
jgi:hypothetical protein